jgi:hypothetical protein
LSRPTVLEEEDAMAIEELLKRQRAALEAGDVAGARKLFGEIQAEIDREDAWDWLDNNEPEGYEQLIGTLEQPRKRPLAPSSQAELDHLIEVFKWCRDHGIELAELEVSEYAYKYREAVAYMRRITESDEPAASQVAAMRGVIERIKRDAGQQATRARARGWKGKGETARSRGHQFALEDGRVGLVIVGPSATIRRIRSRVKWYVDWDLSVDDALLSELLS